jgi:acyl carrier protein|tara:strand:- start:283 stop:552 length:270 start_codon:yes stop_codon:yes gene_type:complete
MKTTDLLKHISEILKTDVERNPILFKKTKVRKLTLNMKLKDIKEWDSLALISLISLYDQLFSKVVSISSINKCITIKDLINLVKKNLSD